MSSVDITFCKESVRDINYVEPEPTLGPVLSFSECETKADFLKFLPQGRCLRSKSRRELESIMGANMIECFRSVHEQESVENEKGDVASIVQELIKANRHSLTEKDVQGILIAMGCIEVSSSQYMLTPLASTLRSGSQKASKKVIHVNSSSATSFTSNAQSCPPACLRGVSPLCRLQQLQGAFHSDCAKEISVKMRNTDSLLNTDSPSPNASLTILRLNGSCVIPPHIRGPSPLAITVMGSPLTPHESPPEMSPLVVHGPLNSKSTTEAGSSGRTRDVMASGINAGQSERRQRLGSLFYKCFPGKCQKFKLR